MATGEDFKIITKSGGEIVFPSVENSPAFSGTASYVVGDKVYEGSTRYECIEDVAAPASGTNPAPSQDSTHWALSTVEIVTDSEVVAPADATEFGQIADALAVKNALAGKIGNSGSQVLSGNLSVVSYGSNTPSIGTMLSDQGVMMSPIGFVRVIGQQSYIVNIPATGGTLALLQNLADDFLTSDTYAVNDLCVYNKLLYRCTTAVTTAGDWTGSTNWEVATVDDVLSALTSDIPYAINEVDLSAAGGILSGTLYDHRVNTVSVDMGNDVSLTLPAQVAGKSRDFFVRFVVTGSGPSGDWTIPNASFIGTSFTNDLPSGSYVFRFTEVLNGTTSPSANPVFLVTGQNDTYAIGHKAPLDSPPFTGTPTAPTPTSSDNSGKIATTAFVQDSASAVRLTEASDVTRYYMEWVDPVDADETAGGYAIIYFIPTAFGATANCVVRSVTIKSASNSATLPTIPVYAKIIDPDASASALAVSQPVTMSETSTDYTFVFDKSPSLTYNKQYRLVFYSGASDGSPTVAIGVRVRVMSEYQNIYYAADTKWRPQTKWVYSQSAFADDFATKTELRYSIVSPTLTYSTTTTTNDTVAATLNDRAANNVTLGSDVAFATFTFPATVSGKARDFILRLTLTGETVPTITFRESGGAAVSFDADDNAWAEVEQGVNVISFTDTNEAS